MVFSIRYNLFKGIFLNVFGLTYSPQPQDIVDVNSYDLKQWIMISAFLRGR